MNVFVLISLLCAHFDCFLTDNSARVQMENYIATSEVVIGYIEKLFNSNELGLDW